MQLLLPLQLSQALDKFSWGLGMMGLEKAMLTATVYLEATTIRTWNYLEESTRKRFNLRLREARALVVRTQYSKIVHVRFF